MIIARIATVSIVIELCVCSFKFGIAFKSETLKIFICFVFVWRAIMDFLIYSGYYIALFIIPIAIYTLIFKQHSAQARKDLFYLIKYYFARSTVKQYQNAARLDLDPKFELGKPKSTSNKTCDKHEFYGIDSSGNYLALKFTISNGLEAQIELSARLEGQTFALRNIAVYQLKEETSWRCKDLQLDFLDAFHRVRVSFNGLLQNGNGEMEHVRINFIWVAGAAPVFYPADVSPHLLVQAIASCTWRDGNWLRFLGDENKRGYEQFGTIYASIWPESLADSKELHLQSTRSHFWGEIDQLHLKQRFKVFVATKHGMLVNLNVESSSNGASSVKYGAVILPNGNQSLIADVFDEFDFKTAPPATFTFHLKTNEQVFKIVSHLMLSQQSQIVGNGFRRTLTRCECDLNTNQAKGLVDFWHNTTTYETAEMSKKLVLENFDNCQKYVLDLNEKEAISVNLSGGKGSSLAQLVKIAKTHNFNVPPGFVITSQAYRQILKENPQIQQAVNSIAIVFCQKRENLADEQTVCAATVKLFESIEIPRDIQEAIKEKLNKGKRWAVRSSGLCEDGDELSAAGQNATFLGCGSLEDVLDAICKCWASLYTFQSVQYRHQHGLDIASEMAVVLQEMVASDCAGVLFTCHPSSGNPKEMFITANYGLGESVVSGLAEPDTVILERNGADLKIKSKTMGAKAKIVKMSTKSSGTEEIEATNAEFSLSDEQAMRLGQVGSVLEDYFQDYRDIEWAFHENQLYLLQARPITTILQNWTDFELLHEFNDAVFGENVVYTVGNTGEVFPGCISVLTLTSIAKCLQKAIEHSMHGKADDFRTSCLGIYEHHVFVDVVNSLYRLVTPEITVAQKSLDLAIFGHLVLNSDLQNLAKERHGYAGQGRMVIELGKMVKTAWKNLATLSQAKKMAQIEIPIDFANDSAAEMYEKIQNHFDIVQKVSLCHSNATAVSVFYQSMAMNILLGQEKEFNLTHYNDFALILSSCDDVISAEIPAHLELIANQLKMAELNVEFAQIDLEKENGEVWLEKRCKSAYNEFLQFIQTHGHRALGEFDLLNRTWQMQRAKVLKMIQANCKSGGGGDVNKTKAKNEVKTVDEIINSLESQQGGVKGVKRRILKFFIGKCRKAVGIREQTKSEIVRVVNRVRIAYGELAKKMVQNGQLPNEELIYFLSNAEILHMVQSAADVAKSPLFIKKALRRQRLFAQWNRMKFAEISNGLPLDLGQNEVPLTVNGSDVKLSGTPICSGVIKARACVLNSLNEIDLLQQGDILITYSTDIGWSPYFPMLSGIVTELGGLVSHGAVIAREYGLPSIVGVQGATAAFKTGDTVLLSGKTGTIELV